MSRKRERIGMKVREKQVARTEGRSIMRNVKGLPCLVLFFQGRETVVSNIEGP